MSNYKRENTIIITIESREGWIWRMNDNMDIKIIKKYEIIKKVGKGAYGQVWKCTNKRNKQVCALKRIFDAFRNVTDCQRTYREIMYLKQLSHPNIIKLHHYQKSYNDRDMYIEMEFVESDLATALKNQYLKDLQKEYVFVQVLAAVHYLHSGNLLHRDIKPSNVLVGINCEAKICDFGLIRTIGYETQDGKLTDNIATRWYKAPQLLLSSSNYGKEIDIWSLGCLLGELYLGKPIFQGTSTFNQLQKIIKITGIPNIDYISDIIQSETSIAVLKSFINDYPSESQKKEKKESIGTLNLSSTKSKSTSSLAQYQNTNSLPENYSQFYDIIPSLRDTDSSNGSTGSNNRYVVDLLTKLLQFDPRKRIKMQDIIEHPYCSRFRNKVEWKKMEKMVRVKYDNMKLSIDDYKLLLSNQIKNNPELSIGVGKGQNNRSSPSRDKLSKSIDRQENPRGSIYVPNQAKVSPLNYGTNPTTNNTNINTNTNSNSNTSTNNNKSISSTNRGTPSVNTSIKSNNQTAQHQPIKRVSETMSGGSQPSSQVGRGMLKQQVKCNYPHSIFPINNNSLSREQHCLNVNANLHYNQMNNNTMNTALPNTNTYWSNASRTGASNVGGKYVNRVQVVQMRQNNRYSQLPTTYITTNYPRISTCNQDREDRSEKSVSIHKSDNKSISNKSFRSNLSNVSTCKQKANHNINTNNSNNNVNTNSNINNNNTNNYRPVYTNISKISETLKNQVTIENSNNVINSNSGTCNHMTSSQNENKNTSTDEAPKDRDKSKSNKAGNMSITSSYSISNAVNGRATPIRQQLTTDKFNYRESIDKKMLPFDQIRTNYYHKLYPKPPQLVRQENSINSVSPMSSINSINPPSNTDKTKQSPQPNLFIQIPSDPKSMTHPHTYHPYVHQGFGRHSTVSSPYNSPTANVPRTSFQAPVFPSTPPPIVNGFAPQQPYISQHKQIYPNQCIQTSVNLHSPSSMGMANLVPDFSTAAQNHGNIGLLRVMK